jgi:hypothetical protein
LGAGSVELSVADACAGCAGRHYGGKVRVSLKLRNRVGSLKILEGFQVVPSDSSIISDVC